jgi:hypothetical protein
MKQLEAVVRGCRDAHFSEKSPWAETARSYEPWITSPASIIILKFDGTSEFLLPQYQRPMVLCFNVSDRRGSGACR